MLSVTGTSIDQRCVILSVSEESEFVVSEESLSLSVMGFNC